MLIYRRKLQTLRNYTNLVNQIQKSNKTQIELFVGNYKNAYENFLFVLKTPLGHDIHHLYSNTSLYFFT